MEAQGNEPESPSLRNYLFASDLPNRVVVSPLLEPEPSGNTIDVRLGTKFVLTKRSQFLRADPLTLTEEQVHSFLQVHWARIGESVALHPQMFMLAATLEYVSLPAGVSAQVNTRSSYGRLGALAVTAPRVHPGYKGCLTLELVNFGDSAILLTPGLRIAQLTIEIGSKLPVSAPGKYHMATDPMFPRIWEDSDLMWLQEARRKSEDATR